MAPADRIVVAAREERGRKRACPDDAVLASGIPIHVGPQPLVLVVPAGRIEHHIPIVNRNHHRFEDAQLVPGIFGTQAKDGVRLRIGASSGRVIVFVPGDAID